MSRGVELHNVAETTETDEGTELARLPDGVREALNEKAEDNYRRPSGVEIRFVPEGEWEVTLSSEGTCEVTPFWGPFQSDPAERVEIGAEPTTIELSFPERLADLRADAVDPDYFDPQVCRLMLRGNPVRLHGVEGDLRPPRGSEVPDTRYLAYGTSISQGAVATDAPSTYVAETARRVGADLLNLGTGGSAFCEPEIADYIAGAEWDVATLAVSVNMLAVGFSAAEFRERADYLLNTVAGENPEKPVVAITLFPLHADLCEGTDTSEWDATPEAYREALRGVVRESDHRNLSLLEGETLLDVAGLSPDLLHPTDRGMGRVAERLAPELADRLA